ncbi:MAG: coenzyme F420-0:L-glutamate ligase [Thermoprotei archaeon]|nr:coenzyme F420-0:L-glutamate ligase [Thermoprotei archaeon]
MTKLEVFGLKLPEVKPGDDLARLIVEAASREAGGLRDGDVIVVTSKVVSKAYGLLINIDEVKPSKKAFRIAKMTGVDPKIVQVILENSDNVLFVIPIKPLVERKLIGLEELFEDPEHARKAIDMIPYMLIVERGGQVYSDAGLDFSNHPEGIASIPPRDPDRYAKLIRDGIRRIAGVDVAVVISDTEMFLGVYSLDFARGSSGIEVVSKKFGALDRFGKPKFGGVDHIAHELACAAALLMGQTDEGVPAVLFRGLRYVRSEEGIKAYSLKPEAMKIVLKLIIKETIRVLGIRSLLRLII